ncbi:hypothetical protein POTOM_054830 [Populus tomentosa]|uniref:Uncharacterized protein n=1 Tax=Populus tomentosa TaxID=118781 RepID=A0A8X7XZH6_POPTO|nr:hypothetical protein POTOM_054829 [Populus tomentosa]KAG6741566.1 hypothetical protein POTOM_054830 [Populus tomentosa]
MPQGNVVLLAGDWSQVHPCLPHVHEKEMGPKLQLRAQIMLSVDSLSFLIRSYDSRPFALLSPNRYSERSNTYIDCWRLMASSKALLILGVFMLLMTTFVAGDVADTVRDKPRYISYGGLGCDPKKNPRCRLNPNPTLSGRGCKAEHRCREG